MAKFNFGDKVKVHVARGWVDGTIIGIGQAHYCTQTCYLTRVPEGYGWHVSRKELGHYKYFYGLVLEVGKSIYWNAYEDTMKFIGKAENDAKPSKRRIIIEITDDGATAKYIVGKKVEKTSAVKQYSYDKPSDKAAAYYVVCKLFGGDLSEVVEKLTTDVASADKARDLLVDLIKGN